MSKRQKIRAALAVLATTVGTAVLAAPANAGGLVADATGCVEPQLSQPFARWFDPMRYTPVPGGSMEEGAAGWQLEGGASVVAGNEPFHVRAATDEASLSLPAGSRATSPTICVGLEEPTLRFFAARTRGLLSVLALEVLFEDAAGTVRALPIGLDAGGDWHPSAPLPVIANLLTLGNGKTPVRFRFTPRLGGDWLIDDVYVDPWRAR